MIYINRFFFNIFDKIRELYLNSSLYDKKISKTYYQNLIYKPSPHLLSSLIKYQKKKFRIEDFALNEIWDNKEITKKNLRKLNNFYWLFSLDLKSSKKNKNFKLVIKGELSLELLHSFVSLDINRDGNSLKLIKHGFLEIQNHDSKIYKFGNESEQLRAKIKINKPGLTLQIIKSGSVGLAEAYMRNEFETDNLTNLIEITAKNIKIVYKFSGIFDLSMINKLKSIFIKNNKSRSKKNISKHYDLGNEFFSLWLDKTLTYSSAIFENEKNNLEEAQINKYKKLSHLIKPRSGDKMLEIGCGWGGYAEFVGKNFDVKLDCITISKKQFDFAKERIFKNKR